MDKGALVKQISYLMVMVFLVSFVATQFARAQQTAFDYFIAGLEDHEAGQYFDAIQDFDKALALDPNDAFAYSNRSISNRRLGKLSQADSDSRIAKKIDSAVSC